MSNAAFQSFADAPLARRMLELSPAAVAVLSADGTVVFVNEKLTQLLGYTSEDLIGRSSKVFLCDMSLCDHEAHSVVSLSHISSNENRTEKKITLKSKDGLDVPVIVHLHPIIGSQEMLWLTHLFSADNRSPDHDLLESERLAAIAQMVSGLAHESRNALQCAVASLDLLELDLRHNPEQMALSRRIRKALDDLLENYDEVRRYAEPIAIRLQPVRLLAVCQVAFAEIIEKKSALRHRLDISSDTDMGDVARVDYEKMKIVFHRVLDNAIDSACSAAAHIAVHCQRLPIRNIDVVKLKIRDHGPGFDVEALRNAFRPFFTTKQHGTGLGLAICRRIVEAHHGEISVANHSEGGAIVEVTIPVNAAHP